jgi:hypothetical protein
MRSTKLGILATLPLAAALGCAADDTATTDDPQVADTALTASFGGQTETDEAPEFADPAFAQGDLAFEDAAANDPTTAAANATTGIRILVAWGYLRPHPDATDAVDWSGSIQVTNAAVRVVRTVRFEAQDMVIRPRTDPATIAFQSKTKPAADGLVLEVVPSGAPVALTFASAPITNTITLTPGERLSQVIPVDAAGHKLAYHVIRPDHDPCHEGFLRGHWQALAKVGGRSVGVLRGRFFSGAGAVEGHLRGVFGVRKDGKKLFFAKVVGEDGTFRAVVAGVYGDGEFRGRILAAGHVVAGVVHGRYFDADGDKDGRFLGRFSQRCQEDPTEGTPMPADDQPAPSVQ